jgi:hypothetical protein
LARSTRRFHVFRQDQKACLYSCAQNARPDNTRFAFGYTRNSILHHLTGGQLGTIVLGAKAIFASVHQPSPHVPRRRFESRIAKGKPDFSVGREARLSPQLYALLGLRVRTRRGPFHG